MVGRKKTADAPTSPDLGAGEIARGEEAQSEPEQVTPPAPPQAMRGGQVRQAVQWAVDNGDLVTSVSAAGKVSYRWAKALSPPPNSLAKMYVKYAFNNPTSFMKDVVPKILGGEEEEALSQEADKLERKSISSIRGVLAMLERSRQEVRRQQRSETGKVKKAQQAKEKKAVEEIIEQNPQLDPEVIKRMRRQVNKRKVKGAPRHGS
jgi:hypothetical protein